MGSKGKRMDGNALLARALANPHIRVEGLETPILKQAIEQSQPAPTEPPKLKRKPARAKEPNQTEREYEMMLRREHPGCEILWEAYTLRLASRATYTPDYSVHHPDGRIDFHEVKGAYIFPKALVKVRIAAEYFNHRFTVAQKLKSGWEINLLPGKANRQNPT